MKDEKITLSKSALRAMLNRAYDQGFESTSEGYNGEYAHWTEALGKRYILARRVAVSKVMKGSFGITWWKA